MMIWLEKIVLKNNAPVRSSIIKISIILASCQRIIYGGSCSMTSGALWSYYRWSEWCWWEEVRPPRAPVPPEGGDWPPRPPVQPLNTEFTIPLKYYNDFQRSLDFLLVNG